MKKIIYTLSFATIAFLASCGEEDTKIDDGKQDSVVTISDATTELKGYMRGTLKAGKTYYLIADMIVPENETVTVEPGVTVIAVGDGTAIGPEITIGGTFAALGTKAQPIKFTVPADKNDISNIFAGLWGGFQCKTTAKALVLKWCQVEYLGGEGGPASPRAGKSRYGFSSLDPNTEIVVEDCWFRGSVDDMFRPNGGKIHLVRNVFEFAGETGGDGLNIKGGTIGNMAYNLFIGGATNAYKVSNEGSSTVQTNVNVYNNIAINCGYRRAGNTRGANINYEVGARGYAYNNIIVNCKRGMRVLEDGDLQNIKFDNNLYYAAHQAMVDEFIPTDATTPTKAVLGSNNIIGKAGENDPMFVNVNVTQFALADFEAGSTQPRAMNEKGTNDFRLKSGSPCIGKGKTDFSPVSVQWVHATGALAPSTAAPNRDLGAFPTDNSGNQYF